MAIKQYKVSFWIKKNGSYMDSPSMTEIVFSDGEGYEKYLRDRYGDILVTSATEIKETSKAEGSQVGITNNNESDTTWIKFGIVGAILFGLWILLSNIINIGLISKYDFDLYLSNITHFNSGFKRKATSNDTTIDLTYPDKSVGKKYKISKNKIVFYNGYKDSEIDRSTAVALYDKGIKIYGYIKHAKNVEPLKPIDSEIVSKVDATINSRYKKDLESKVKLYQAKTKKEIEGYENKNYTKISQISNKEIAYFHSIEDTDLVENLESKYYDDEVYEKEFSKLGDEYYSSLK